MALRVLGSAPKTPFDPRTGPEVEKLGLTTLGLLPDLTLCFPARLPELTTERPPSKLLELLLCCLKMFSRAVERCARRVLWEFREGRGVFPGMFCLRFVGTITPGQSLFKGTNHDTI